MLSYMDLNKRFLTPLRSLLTIATGRDCRLLAADVGRDAEEWLRVLTAADEPPDQSLAPHQVLLRLRELRLDGVARWPAEAETLNPIPPIVAKSIRGDCLTLETET